MAIIFNGEKLAQKLEKEIKKQVEDLKKKFGFTPKLVSIVVGGDKSSLLYLAGQEKAAKRVGILFEKKVFSPQVDPKQIYQYINSLNQDEKVHGIVIQLPLPERFDSSAVASQIDPKKDVDCLTSENLRLLSLGKPVFLPAVVKAVMTIIASIPDRKFLTIPDRNKFTPREKLRNKKVVVVGASGFVGRPLVAHLENLGVTVISCDEYTKNLGERTKKGDILISATGVAGLIKKEMVKKRAVVIDVGSPKAEVDFEEVKKIASFITPVPGGVGPLTIACLLENVLLATKCQFEQEQILEERLKLI